MDDHARLPCGRAVDGSCPRLRRTELGPRHRRGRRDGRLGGRRESRARRGRRSQGGAGPSRSVGVRYVYAEDFARQHGALLARPARVLRAADRDDAASFWHCWWRPIVSPARASSGPRSPSRMRRHRRTRGSTHCWSRAARSAQRTGLGCELTRPLVRWRMGVGDGPEAEPRCTKLDRNMDEGVCSGPFARAG